MTVRTSGVPRMLRIVRCGLLLASCCGMLFLPVGARAALDAGETAWDGSQPPQGVYFHWYEPSFYTGFAPRTQDPSRLHIELGRGNQVRVTVVLGDAELDNYLGDLDARHKTYQELIDRKIMVLTTNREYERFVKGLEDQGVAAAARGGDASRKKAIDVMSALNPERVFRVHLPVATLAAAWHSVLTSLDESSDVAKLDAANAVLPGRVNLTALTPEISAALSRASAAARSGGADSSAFRSEVEAFITAATAGHYRATGGAVDAVEFTTIYPAGTVEGTTSYKGEKLPDFGVTGIWPLMRRDQGRGQTGMVDYLSTNPGYGFIPLLAYQHAGGITYNAFHNAGVRCQLDSTPFLPPAWRKATSERDGKAMQNLWVVGRGPTSHGCTRLPSGHMSELRQIVPSESDTLTRVPTFRDLPQCYDVFDIDADGKPEAMGVQFYLAYRSNEHTPVKTWISNKREPFYKWLYGNNIEIGPVGKSQLRSVPVCRFAGRKAQEAKLLSDVPLHEASYVPEAIQFYTIKPVSFESGAGFNFNRELRKVGAGHTTDRKMLLLN
ncbi:MAG TPA: hypothetical protein VN634_03760 [Candidatus Limnocylindrales bacterium]|nr:hypothetical protein [Candidatus Limnocylindrales bacterium]